MVPAPRVPASSPRDAASRRGRAIGHLALTLVAVFVACIGLLSLARFVAGSPAGAGATTSRTAGVLHVGDGTRGAFDASRDRPPGRVKASAPVGEAEELDLDEEDPRCEIHPAFAAVRGALPLGPGRLSRAEPDIDVKRVDTSAISSRGPPSA